MLLLKYLTLPCSKRVLLKFLMCCAVPIKHLCSVLPFCALSLKGKEHHWLWKARHCPRIVLKRRKFLFVVLLLLIFYPLDNRTLKHAVWFFIFDLFTRLCNKICGFYSLFKTKQIYQFFLLRDISVCQHYQYPRGFLECRQNQTMYYDMLSQWTTVILHLLYYVRRG